MKKEIIVKWEWPYETGENADAITFNDKKDTQDAIADLDYTFDVVVTGTQSKQEVDKKLKRKEGILELL